MGPVFFGTASSSAPAEQPSSSLECPEGFQIVNGKCVPIESSAQQGTQDSAPADTASSSAAQ